MRRKYPRGMVWGEAIRAGFLLAAKICDPDLAPRWSEIPELADLNATFKELEETPAYKKLVTLVGDRVVRMLKRVACMKILMKEVGEAVKSRDLDKVKDVLAKLFAYAQKVGVSLSDREKEKLQELLSAIGISVEELTARIRAYAE